MEKQIKKLNILAKALLIASLISGALINLFIDDLPILFCFDTHISLYIFPIIFVVAALFLRARAADLSKERIFEKDFLYTLILAIIIFLFTSVFLVTLSTHSGKAREARAKSAFNELNKAQTLFYAKNKRYADTQQELVSEGFTEDVWETRLTKKPYSDKDGQGIEGGDNDPQTWSVQFALESYKIEVCRLGKKPVEMLYCDQTGCGERLEFR